MKKEIKYKKKEEKKTDWLRRSTTSSLFTVKSSVPISDVVHCFSVKNICMC